MTERAPGVWRLRVRNEYGQIEKTFRGSKTAAAKELASLAGHARQARPKRGARTVGQLLDEWLEHISALGRAPKTLDEARREIENRIRPRLGAIRLGDLTAKDLDEAYRVWRQEVSASTVHRHAMVISAALNQAVKWGYLDANPAVKATPPPQRPTRKIVTPTPSQVADLIRTAEERDPVMAAAVALAFVTGARRGELCALRWSDVDLDMGSVRIERALTQIGEDLMEKGTKSNQVRMVALDPRAVALLQRHRDWQEQLAEGAESPLVADPYVLSDNANAGRPIVPSHLTDRFTALRARTKVNAVRFHDLRHASITQLLGAGVDVKTVSARAGHASARMTLDRYAHALPAGDVAAAAVIGAMLPSGN
jgi:integrase